MLERFDPVAHQIVRSAQDEARSLGHREIGAGHLLAGVVIVGAPPDLALSLLLVRAAVLELHGGPQNLTREERQWLRLSDEVTSVLEAAAAAAVAQDGPDASVHPPHVLLALIDRSRAARSALIELGVDIDALRARARQAASEGARFEVEDDPMAAEDLVPVAIGFGEPLGALGETRVDGLVLLAVLARGGPAAGLLRSHGVDDGEVRTWAAPGLALQDGVGEALQTGAAVPITLGNDATPVGDIGNPRTDGRVLLALLAYGGPGGAILRQHGLDEQRVQTLLSA